MNQEWYYRSPEGTTHGPLPIETIRTAVEAGRLTENVAIARGADGPWAELREVNALGSAAFNTGGNRAPQMPSGHGIAKVSAGASRKSVSGFVDVIGYVFIAGGLLCLVGVAATLGNGSQSLFPMVAGALGNMIAGVMFLALAEGLKRLEEIARILQSERDSHAS